MRGPAESRAPDDAVWRSPRPEVELAWLLVGTRERRASSLARMRDLAKAVPSEAVLAELARQRVSLVGGTRAAELGLLDDTSRRLLNSALVASRRRSFLMEAVLVEAVAGLEAAGIAALPLKGPRLARMAHGDPGLRQSVDLDVLVAPYDLDGAERALHAMGYYRHPDAHRSPIHLVFKHEQSWRPPLELHWRLHWYGEGLTERLLAASAVGADGVRDVDVAATLVYLLFLYARDGFVGLRMAADIAALADAVADDPDLVHAWMTAEPELDGPLTTAVHVAERVVGMPRIGPTRVLGRREAVAGRLANWRIDSDLDQVNAVVRLIDLILAPAGRRRQFLTSSFRPFPTVRANALYLAKTTARWVPAATSVLGGRMACPLPPSR